MKSKEELKKLFENGDKPTQEEFWEWQDSYWHKDEKLPTENTGGYKIKGSVPDLVALHLMNNMVEGDVYNLLDTGDNYVYVLDLNNTGEAGWDKLSGITDLSTINLQTGIDNGHEISGYNGQSSYSLRPSDDSGEAHINFIQAGTKNGSLLSTYFRQVVSPSWFPTGMTEIAMGVQKGDALFGVKLADSALEYENDYSAVFKDRTLVDKGYVDSKITPATLQTVLENSSMATDEATGSFILMNHTGVFQTYFQDSSAQETFAAISNSLMSSNIINRSPLGNSFIDVTSNNILLAQTHNASGLSTYVILEGNKALEYGADYSSKFTDRSLVDKAYVDNAISNSGSVLKPISYVTYTNGSAAGFIKSEIVGNYVNLGLNLSNVTLQVDEAIAITIPHSVKPLRKQIVGFVDYVNYVPVNLVLLLDGSSLQIVNKNDNEVSFSLNDFMVLDWVDQWNDVPVEM